MVEPFCATWKVTYSQNFDEYTKALGVGFASRQVDYLGEEFDETTIGDRICKSVVSLDGDKLVHVQKWDAKKQIL